MKRESVKSPSPYRTTDQAFIPDVLSWPARHENDECRIDDLDRHLAARAALARAVSALCRKYRREFPAHRYAVTTEGSHREVARLLEQYGGLPQGTGTLNGVPAEVLEKAVEAFIAYFGLQEGVVGNLRRSGSIPAEADPKPRTNREVEAAPW